jgi:hypothetical protein
MIQSTFMGDVLVFQSIKQALMSGTAVEACQQMAGIINIIDGTSGDDMMSDDMMSGLGMDAMKCAADCARTNVNDK